MGLGVSSQKLRSLSNLYPEGTALNLTAKQALPPGNGGGNPLAPEAPVFIKDYKCHRCGCETFSKGEARVATSFLGRLFNVESGRFITASCNLCGYTEFYKRGSSTFGNILDLLGN